MDTVCDAAGYAQCLVAIESQEEQMLLSHPLVYRFCRIDFAAPQYYIEVRYRGQRAAAYLGSEHSAARLRYEMMARGTVTPCTLQEIARDLCAQAEFF